MATITAPITVEEFLKLPDDAERRVELVDGEIVEMPTGKYPHERTKGNVIQILAVWLNQHPVGTLFAEAGFRLDQHWAPVPDVSVVLNERLTSGIRDYIQGAPDLAVEVVSSESADYLLRKVQAYLKQGGKVVWVVYPEQRVIQVYAASHTAVLGEQQVLEDHDVMPGFSTPVAALFRGI